MSKPMSNRLLVHSSTLTPAGTVDADGNSTAGTAVNLTKVRVISAKQNAMTALGESKNDKLVLIFDCKASLPLGTTFKANDLVTYPVTDGIQYTIRSVDARCSNSSVTDYYRVNLTDGN